MPSRKTLSRRSFLGASTVLAATAAGSVTEDDPTTGAAEEAHKPPPLDDRPLSLAVVGCGRQAMRNLIPAALRIPGNRITAVCDIVAARREAARETAGKQARAYEDYRELLRQADVEGVIVATPLHTHRDIVLEAFRHERDVFCETTLGYTIDESKEMVRTAMITQRVLQVGHHRRYSPFHIAARRLLKHNMFGRINNIHCQWNRNISWRRPVEKPDADFAEWGYGNADELRNWHLYRKFSGGLMTEVAIHQFDIVNDLLGDAVPQAVTGVGKIDRRDGRTVFDNVHLIYEFPNGVQLTYEAITTNGYNPFGDEMYEMIQGDKGTLILTPPSEHQAFFFLEPQTVEPLWAPLASKVDFDHGNLKIKAYRKAIVAARPSEGELRDLRTKPSWLAYLFDSDQTPSPYDLELLDFKRSVLDRGLPLFGGALAAMKSAIAVHAGLKAMEEQRRIEITKEMLRVT